MSDTRFESEIVKSLEKLDEILNKSQIQTGGQSKVTWSGGDTEEYDSDTDTKWDDDINENGTDYVKKGKGDDEEPEPEEEEEERGGGYGFQKSQSASRGVEVSVFLNELTKSIAIYCNNLEGFIEKSIMQVHVENGEMAKAIASNLLTMNEVIEKSQDNIVRYAEEPVRGPKSMLDMNKSLGDTQGPEFSKSQVLEALLKGVEAGVVSPLEVIKCEQLGVQAVSENVVKSLLA